MADKRLRVFATILWKESVTENFIQIIDDWHVPAFLSPLHDKDMKEDGTLKKEHWHLMVMFDGKKSDDQVRELFSTVGGVGLERIQSGIGMARYLIHLDNPEKYQYNRSDVTCFGGADYEEYILKSKDEIKFIIELSIMIIDNDIDNVADAFMLCYELERHDLMTQLTKRSSFWFTQLCKASAYRKKKMVDRMRMQLAKEEEKERKEQEKNVER